MEYLFKGIITSFKNYKIPFQLKDGHLRLDVSNIPSNEINRIDVNGNEILGGIPRFNQEYLGGKTDDGLIIKLHVHSYYDGDQCFGYSIDSLHYIYGNVSSCIVLERDSDIDKVGFFSFDINKITGYSCSGQLTESDLKSLGYNDYLADYLENNNKYYVCHDFLNKKPFVNSPIITINSDKPLSLIMMEDIYWTFRSALSFLYQRKDVPILDSVLINDDSVIGHLFIQKSDVDQNVSLGVKCLQVMGWGNKLSNLFQAIVNKKIYSRHLPYYEKDKNTYNASRYLMTVIGVESTIDTCGIKVQHSSKHQAAIEEVNEELTRLRDGSNRTKRKEYNKILFNYNNDRFEEKINAAIKENIDYISNFYNINQLVSKSTLLGAKIAKSRNKFAHGNLEEDLNEEHANQCDFLDLFILYLQLLYIGFSKKEASEIVPLITHER